MKTMKTMHRRGWYALAALAGGVVAAITMWPKKANAMPSHDAPAKAPPSPAPKAQPTQPPQQATPPPAATTMPGVNFDVPGTTAPQQGQQGGGGSPDAVSGVEAPFSPFTFKGTK